MKPQHGEGIAMAARDDGLDLFAAGLPVGIGHVGDQLLGYGDVPDIPGIFANGAVRGEPAHVHRIEDCLVRPVLRPPPDGGHLALCGGIGGEIGATMNQSPL